MPDAPKTTDVGEIVSWLRDVWAKRSGVTLSLQGLRSLALEMARENREHSHA